MNNPDSITGVVLLTWPICVIKRSNLNTFDGLKDQVKLKMREALIKKGGLKQDAKVEDFDIYFVAQESKDGQPDKRITNASEINKLFSPT